MMAASLFLLLAATAASGCLQRDGAGRAAHDMLVFDPDDPRVPQAYQTARGAAFAPSALPFPLFSEPVNITLEHGFLEASLAISPVDDTQMLVCTPSGLGSGLPSTSVGHPGSHFYHSRNGGTTWVPLNVETNLDARRATAEGGDCDVAFDAAGTLYVADLWGGSIAFAASRDGGSTWTHGTPLAGLPPPADRPWLAGGSPGQIHLTYQDIQLYMPGVIWHTRSDDFGESWSDPQPITTAAASGAFTWNGNLVVAADSLELYTVYTRRAAPLGEVPGRGGQEVWITTSTDGGQQWQEHLVSQRPGAASFLYPGIARDMGGGLHIVFAQNHGPGRPIFHAFSGDGGKTWSEPAIMVAGVRAFAPWVAAGLPGQAVVMFMAFSPPGATARDDSAWFLHWARVTGAQEAPTYEAGTTTRQPMHVGSGEEAEYNQIDLDSAGMARLGAAVPYDATGAGRWRVVYMEQALGPPT